MVAIYRALGLDVSRTPKVGKKRLRLTYDKELTKTLKHLRYKGNTIIEKKSYPYPRHRSHFMGES